MSRSLGEAGEKLGGAELFSLFRSELARVMADEAGLSGDALSSEVEKAARGDSMPLRFLRRTRHWSDGGIIGSKAFVLEIGSRFRDASRLKRRLSRGTPPDGGPLYCVKRLRKTD